MQTIVIDIEWSLINYCKHAVSLKSNDKYAGRKLMSDEKTKQLKIEISFSKNNKKKATRRRHHHDTFFLSIKLKNQIIKLIFLLMFYFLISCRVHALVYSKVLFRSVPKDYASHFLKQQREQLKGKQWQNEKFLIKIPHDLPPHTSEGKEIRKNVKGVTYIFYQPLSHSTLSRIS